MYIFVPTDVVVYQAYIISVCIQQVSLFNGLETFLSSVQQCHQLAQLFEHSKSVSFLITIHHHLIFLFQLIHQTCILHGLNLANKRNDNKEVVICKYLELY